MKSKFKNSSKEFIKSLNFHNFEPSKVKEYREFLYDNKLKFHLTDTTINERELYILNHKGWLYGTLYDDFASNEHLLYRFSQRDPKGIIMGELSKTDLFYTYQSDGQNYKNGIFLQKINNESLIARQDMLNYFKTDFNKSLYYFKEQNDYTCCLADMTNKNKIFDPTLTSAHYSCYHDEIKLFYGGNPKILTEEDLAMNLELSELQKCYVESLEKFKILAKHEFFQPCLNLLDFSIHFKNIVMKSYTELLYDKKCQYSASVFRKIHEIYDQNILLMPNSLVNLTYSYIVDSLCPDFNKIFRNKQIIKKLNEMKPSEKNFEEIIEKIVIINLLCYDEIKEFIFSGVNPLKEIFLGLFKDYPLKKVMETYKKYYLIYVEPLIQIFTEDLKRIDKYDTDGRKFLRNYDEEIKTIEKENRNEILIDKINMNYYMDVGMKILMIYIANNLKKRELKGENMMSTKLALKKLFVDGIKTKETVNNYNQLLVEANSELKIFKLPKSFKKYEKNFKERIMENYQDISGENLEETIFRAIKKIQEENYEFENEIRTVKTGAEPELMIKDIRNAKKKTTDFFHQSKFIETIISEKNSDELKKLLLKNDSKKNINKHVSIEELDNEIKRLNTKLNVQNMEELYHDEKYDNPNMDKIKEMEEKKSDKLNSITEFRSFNEDSRQSENDETNKNDTSNTNFFRTRIDLENDRKILKRLENVRELRMANKCQIEEKLEEMDNPESNPISYIDLDIFSNKSLEELKNLEIEEIHESDLQIKEDGQASMHNVKMSDGFYRLSTEDALKNSSIIDLSEQQAEKSFNMKFELIKKDLHTQDRRRSDQISSALERGEYIDDPIYVYVLKELYKYKKLRENFLIKYYQTGEINGKLPNNRVPLLVKYLNKDADDMIQDLHDEGVLEKYQTDLDKSYVKMLREFNQDLEHEEKDEETHSNLMEYEDSLFNKDDIFNINELQKNLDSPYDDEYNPHPKDIENFGFFKQVSADRKINNQGDLEKNNDLRDKIKEYIPGTINVNSVNKKIKKKKSSSNKK